MADVSEAEHVAEMSLVAPDRGHPELFSDVTYVELDLDKLIFLVLQIASIRSGTFCGGK